MFETQRFVNGDRFAWGDRWSYHISNSGSVSPKY